MVTSPLQDSTNKCTVSGPVQESAIVVVEGAEDKDIPSPFPFPLHYPPAIEVGLKLKDLQPPQQANFYTRIANVMLLYKRYPTKTDFETVAREVGVKYPFLKSPLDPVVSRNKCTGILYIHKSTMKVYSLTTSCSHRFVLREI